MFHALSSAEIAQIKHDFESLLLSPEATPVTINYWHATEASNPDDVYDVDDAAKESVSVPDVRCLQHIVGHRDEEILDYGILHAGDAVFYFSVNLDLQSPMEGKPVFEDSIKIVDPDGIEWSPVLEDLGPLGKHLLTRIGGSQVAQSVAARLKG